ncbi:MAG TPA: DUF86 domain-containing protein [bacterium]|nr:DUF86 domain-containing protein [bacterium]
MELPIPVKNRLEKLEVALNKLDNLSKISLSEFLTDWKCQDSACRNFQVAIEICLDIGTFLLSEKNLPIPDTYSLIIKELRENGIIDKNLEEDMKKLIKFRNIIVHEYLYIDLEKVYKNFSYVDTFRKFADTIIKYFQV